MFHHSASTHLETDGTGLRELPWSFLRGSSSVLTFLTGSRAERRVGNRQVNETRRGFCELKVTYARQSRHQQKSTADRNRKSRKTPAVT